ncbi:coth protein-domain-containing protein [Halteromyces radiatus]|uniref:coth protein-domain-containing protein n=1 Tax=Halteromyces radiatus TaxID=101107 RepID=UPI00221EBB10|nr:coth protein-domain-containing protein [Halteromyces radiatus]KAI8099678.1 coth protein-domain-containing protein [Halteromyces radiatus]
MEPIVPGSILHQVSAPKATIGYKYVHIDRTTKQVQEAEPFDRTPDDNDKDDDGDDNDGLNEFYGRSWTHRTVKTFNPVDAFPQAYNRRPAPILHPDNEIPTFHIQAPQDDIDRLHGYYLQDIDIKANITYITSTDALHFADTKLKLSGRSTRLLTKLSYSINLPKKSSIDGYRKIKLRACGTDPSYIREKLAYDMLSAVGRPGARNNFIRLFINNRAVGLFLLVERYDDNWLQNEFGSGKTSYENGILYQGEGMQRDNRHAADLSFHGNDPTYYQSSAYSVTEKPKVATDNLDEDLISFTKFIDDQLKLDKRSVNSNTTVNAWNDQIDINGYFLNLAMDFLMGNFDNYVQNTNNYFLYKDPIKKRFIYINWDMDMVLGSGPVALRQLIKGDYHQYKGIDLRPLTKASLAVPQLRQVFESQLAIVVQQVFHPNISFPVIDSLVAFLQEDIQWDQSLPRMRQGINFVPFGPHNIDNWFHNNSTGNTVSLPLTIDFIVAADYLIRVNEDIPFQRAIEGPIHHSSLYPLKLWFSKKTNNVLSFISSSSSLFS